MVAPGAAGAAPEDQETAPSVRGTERDEGSAGGASDQEPRQARADFLVALQEESFDPQGGYQSYRSADGRCEGREFLVDRSLQQIAASQVDPKPVARLELGNLDPRNSSQERQPGV